MARYQSGFGNSFESEALPGAQRQVEERLRARRDGGTDVDLVANNGS